MSKLTVQVVDPRFIHYVWQIVGPMLEKGLARSGGEYTAEHLKLYVIQGSQALLVLRNEDHAIHGAWTVQFTDFPNSRVAFVTSVGGKAMIDQDAWSQFTDWCRSQGATVIRGCAFESVARLWRKAFGVQPRYIVVEKKL